MRWRICECNYGYKNWEQVVLCGKLYTERSLLLSDLFCSSTCLWRCWRHDLHDTGHLEWLVLAQFCILTSCWIFLLSLRIKTGWIPLSILLFKSLSWHCATSADFCLIRVESSWGGFRDCPGFVKKCFFGGGAAILFSRGLRHSRSRINDFATKTKALAQNPAIHAGYGCRYGNLYVRGLWGSETSYGLVQSSLDN